MLQFIYGESNSGKTNLVHQSVASTENSLLIVPEQIALEHEKIMFKQFKVSDGATSFTRLARNILLQYGGLNKPFIQNQDKISYMSLAMISLENNLNIYKHSSLAPKLLNCFSELKFNGVTIEELLEYSNLSDNNRLSNKVNDINLIFSTYDGLTSHSFLDELDMIDKAIAKITPLDYFKDKNIFIDEFKGFTANELRFIELMLISANSVTVSICYSDSRGNFPFDMTKNTINQVMSIARKHNITVKTPVVQEIADTTILPPLRHLEQNLFSRSPQEYKTPIDCIQIKRCTTEYAEVDFVLNNIIKLIVKHDYSYNDIAIVARNLDVYYPKLKSSFERNNIPFFSDIRQPIDSSPVIKFVYHLIKSIDNNFKTQSIIALLRCGLCSFSNEDIGLLDNYAFVWSIDKADWLSPFTQNPRGFQPKLSAEDIDTLERIESLRLSIVEAISPLKQCTTGVEISACIFNIANNVIIKQQDPVFISTWNSLMSILNTLATSISKNKITLKQFLHIFTEICKDYDLGEIPQSQDCLTIGATNRMRLKDKKVLFVLGVNDNVFPFVNSDTGLFSKRELQQMADHGMASSFSDPVINNIIDERFIAYKTLSSCSERLFITSRMADISGSSLAESFLLNDIEKMFTFIPINDPIDGCYAKSSALSKLASNFNDDSQLNNSIFSALSDIHPFSSKLSAMHNAANLSPLAIENHNNTLQLYSDKLSLSPTKIETFSRCQFKYFCEYGLKIKPLKKAELNPLERGNIVHKVLEILGKEQFFTSPFNENLAKQKIKSILDSYLIEVMGGVQYKSSRFIYLYNRTRLTLLKLVKKINLELTDAEFAPIAHELQISNSLLFTSDNGYSVFMNGKVDRVDQFTKNGVQYIRVVDYKTGKKEFKLADIINGLNLQMLIYLNIICNSKAKPSVPAGILYMPSGELTPDLPREVNDASKQLESYVMNGLLLDDDSVLRAMEHDLAGHFIPITLTKSDKYSSASSKMLVSTKEFGYINQYIDKYITGMAEELFDGKISADPLEGSCDFCDYSSVCYLHKCPDRTIDNISKEDALTLISESIEK